LEGLPAVGRWRRGFLLGPHADDYQVVVVAVVGVELAVVVVHLAVVAVHPAAVVVVAVEPVVVHWQLIPLLLTVILY
jgi:hypothetical protein